MTPGLAGAELWGSQKIALGITSWGDCFAREGLVNC